ncbi:MAG TPA: ABC transporter substrate-binding protein [Chloroflexota bacterium]|nr:ABC transporter substrate-binding protein [Chloroflexota bacterium]
MSLKRQFLWAAVSCLGLGISACGGSAAPASAPVSSAAAAAPASSAPAKPAASAPASAAGPAAASAAAKPAASSAAASAAAAAKPGASGLLPIKMVYAQNAAVQEPIFVAKDAGFWAKNGLDVAMTRVGGTAQVPAITSGEAAFANTGANEVTAAVLNGAPLVMIGTLSDLPIFDLYSNKKYASLQDLTGQTIGITAAGASTDAEARLILRKNGLEGKVKIAPSGGTFPSILAAMEQGGIQAGVIGPPFTAEAARKYTKLIDGLTLGPMNVSGLTATKTYLKDHPDVTKQFLKGYVEAWNWAADPANKDQVVKIVAKWTESSDADAEVGYQTMDRVLKATKLPSVDPASVESILSVATDPKAQAADPNTFIDNSFIKSLQ